MKPIANSLQLGMISELFSGTVNVMNVRMLHDLVTNCKGTADLDVTVRLDRYGLHEQRYQRFSSDLFVNTDLTLSLS